MNMATGDNRQRPVILWVEDNPHESLLEFIPEQAREKRIDLRIAKSVKELPLVLEEIGELDRIRGIILDIMIAGAPDLSVFGLPDIKLGHRGGVAGMKLLEHIFRNKDGKFRALNEVPVLVLTVKPTVYPHDLEKYGGSIQLARKYDRLSEWESEVKNWIVERAE